MPPRTHHAGLDLAVEIGSQHVGHARVALDDGEHRFVADACVVKLDRRNGEPFLEHAARRSRHGAGHTPADVVMVAEGLDEGHHLAGVEYRHRAAEVGKMADAAFAEISIVHEKYVTRTHALEREIAHDGVRHGGIRSPGELAAAAVEQADAIIVRLADHGAAGRALDGILDLGLDRVPRCLRRSAGRWDRPCSGMRMPARGAMRAGDGYAVMMFLSPSARR